MDEMESLFPPHKCALYLTHNEHRSYYQTLEAWLDELDDRGDWVSPEERVIAIASDSCWQLQWYPETPIGFNCLLASSLSALLKAVANEGFGEANNG